MKFLATLIAGAAMATGANAITVSGGSFLNLLQTTEINQTGSLGLFDSTLGTLTGVSLTFTGVNTTLIQLTNNAAQSQTVKADGSTNLFFNSSNVPLQGLIAAANPVIVLTASTGFQTLASAASASFGPFPGSQSITWTSQLNSILGSFALAGGGSFTLGCESLSGLNLTGGGGNVASSQQTQAACGGSISYEYREAPPPSVPEPGALALVGLALAGLAMTRRKSVKA